MKSQAFIISSSFERLKGLSLLDEKTVDYVALYNNELFQEYLQLAGQLKSINLNKLIESEEQTRLNTLAFFISIVQYEID